MTTKDTTRVYDPFPIPDHQGLQPTGTIAWERIAQTMVRQVLRLGRHERVIVSADPYFGGAALDAVRQEIQRARAIELATILHWIPALARMRAPNGRYADAEDDAAETAAMRGLFEAADVFILLMNDRRGARATACASPSARGGWSTSRPAATRGSLIACGRLKPATATGSAKSYSAATRTLCPWQAVHLCRTMASARAWCV